MGQYVEKTCFPALRGFPIQPASLSRTLRRSSPAPKISCAAEHRSNNCYAKLQAKPRLNRPAKVNCATMPTLRQYLKDPCTEHRNLEFMDGHTGFRVSCGGDQGANLQVSGEELSWRVPHDRIAAVSRSG